MPEIKGDALAAVKFWQNYYDVFPSKPKTECKDAARSSNFSTFIFENFLNRRAAIVELCCGHGLDSSFFAREGHDVVGIDIASNPAVTDGSWRFQRADLNKLFELSGNRDVPHVLGHPCCFADMVYMRFCLHSVSDECQVNIFNWVCSKLRPGSGLFCIEARSISDALYGQGQQVGRHAFVGSSPHSAPHYRRFLVLEEVLDALQSDFDILFSGQQNGWAVHGFEDPVVIRVVARRKSVDAAVMGN